MCRAYKRSAKEINSEDGFVLVAALIAVMILMALGIWALTTSSQDIKATARSVSEGNALSAAEAGVHTLCAAFNPTVPLYTTTTNIQGSTNASFIVAGQVLTGNVPAAGYNMAVGAIGSNWVYQVYNAQVTGYDNMLNGQVPLSIGIMNPIAVPGSPE
jgi:Tfp pilus assembly protein PilX